MINIYYFYFVEHVTITRMNNTLILKIGENHEQLMRRKRLDDCIVESILWKLISIKLGGRISEGVFVIIILPIRYV